MRFVSTRGKAPAASLGTALFDGLAPDGGLYVPEVIEPWSAGEIDQLPRMSLADIGVRVLKPFVARAIDARTLTAVVHDALDFKTPLVEVEPGSSRSSCFTVRRWRSRTSARASWRG